MSEVSFLRNPLKDREFTDWGPIEEVIEGDPRTFGTMLHRNEDGSSECGIWNCTPGIWRCHVITDELCHFLAGVCTYTSDTGETIEVTPNTVAFFPKDWKGTCEVKETIRKVYMIR